MDLTADQRAAHETLLARLEYLIEQLASASDRLGAIDRLRALLKDSGVVLIVKGEILDQAPDAAVLAELQAKLEALTSEHGALFEQNATLQTQLDEARSQLDTVAGENATLRAQATAQETELTEVRGLLEAATSPSPPATDLSDPDPATHI